MSVFGLPLVVVCLCVISTAGGPLACHNNSSSKTGFVYDESYLLHNAGEHHPESPARLRAIIDRLTRDGVLARLVDIKPSLVSAQWLTSIHTAEYVERVRQASKERQTHLDSRDTGISPESYKVVCLAAGGVLQAVDAVMAGKVKNVFCAVRPPGHHALSEKAMGFCLFNHVAIAARYLQQRHGLSRILIIDWDVHHGNGTEAAFYDDPSVLYFSIHQYPFYPGSGSEKKQGGARGVGYNINVPLPAGSGDEQYLKAFEEKLRPLAVRFDPDFVIISAGFDAHQDDPIGEMQVTTEGFAQMTKIVNQIAEQCCDGRLVSVLEGGYNLAALSDSVAAHISVLRE